MNVRYLILPILRMPFACFSLWLFAVSFTTRLPHWSQITLSVASVLLFFLIPSKRYFRGKIGRRNKMEIALCLLVNIDLLARYIEFRPLAWTVFPLALIFIYSDYRRVDLLILFGAHALIDYFSDSWRPSFAFHLITLLVWGSLAMVFRNREKQKRDQLKKKLDAFEYESQRLFARSDDFENRADLSSKKKQHVIETIKDQNIKIKGFSSLLSSIFHAHTTAIYLYDPIQEAFLLKTYESKSESFSEKRFQAEEGIFKAVSKHQKPIYLVKGQHDLRGLTYYEDSVDVSSVLLYPVRSHRELRALIVMDFTQEKQLNRQEYQVIAEMAKHLLQSLEDSETIHSYFQLKEELATFYSASSALNQTLRMQEVLQALLNMAGRMIEFDLGLICLHDPENKTNRVAAESGQYSFDWVGRSFSTSSSRGLVSWVIDNITPLSFGQYISKQNKSSLFHKKWKVPNRFESILIIPLHVQMERMGALVLMAEKQNVFNRSTRKMIEVLCMQASIAIKNALVVKELEKLATTDGLTGLMNHRTFQETLQNEIARASRDSSSLSLLLIDIDHFKKFNDDYGHPTGDFILQEVAKLLQSSTRSIDFVARYGGEEFAMVLPQTEAKDALVIAKRMVQEIQNTRFKQDMLTLRVTLSIGVAAYPSHALDRESLISYSDTALYSAKNQGRNRALLYTPEMQAQDQEEKELNWIENAEEDLRISQYE
ncbi:MAG: sensor domain-containing diguanylate cyclase [Bdellovibrionota bacterium]